MDQIDRILQHNFPRLLERAHTRRSTDRIIGDAPSAQTTTEKKNGDVSSVVGAQPTKDEEIYDDLDFYHTLLSMFVERSKVCV